MTGEGCVTEARKLVRRFELESPGVCANEYWEQVANPRLVDAVAAALADAAHQTWDAAIKAQCARCAKGEPIRDIAECLEMGHAGWGDCHAYSQDKKGRVDGHIGCDAQKIRAELRLRGPAARP